MIENKIVRIINEEIEKVRIISEEISTPNIFLHTTYRLPTKEDLIDIDNHHLNAKEIVNGFGYTVVGRGINSSKNHDMIIKSIEMLCNQFPDNDEYKKALEIEKQPNHR